MKVILKREFKAYFYTPLGYAFIAVYFLFTGFFFFNYNLYGNNNDMRELFDTLFSITLFLIPILTMRLFSEERKMRTDQILFMSPIFSSQIVLGKFFAATLVYLLGISSTMLAAVILQFMNPPQWPVLIGHFIGLLLLGVALIAIGMFCSVLTENQIVASVAGFCVSFFVMALDGIASMVSIGPLATLLRALSFQSRYSPFTLGILGLNNIIFFISIAALFIVLSINMYEQRKGGSRKLLMVTVALMLVLTSVVNVVADRVSAMQPAVTVDLTEGKLFELSSGTIDMLASLQKPVTIRVIAREDTFADTSVYNKQANEIFHQFARHSSNIALSYIDYVKNPTFATNYPDLTIKHGDILVSSGDNHKVVPTEELFNYRQTAAGTMEIESSKAEEAIARAIIEVTSDEKTRIAMIDGHGEKVMSGFDELLNSNGYEIAKQNLVVDEISSDTKVMIIIAPQTDFTEQELDKLDKFLNNEGQYGKTLMYFADAEQPVLTNLEGFLREWGVVANSGAVFETNENRVYNYQPFYTQVDVISEHYQAMLSGASKPILMPISRAFELGFDSRDNNTTETLLGFSETAGVRPADATEDFTSEQATIKGPLPAMILASYVDSGSGDDLIKSQLVVSASTAMLDASVIDNPSLNNSEFLLKVIQDLTKNNALILIPPKSLAGTGLGITNATASLVGTLFMVGLPFVIIAFGLVIWMRRRSQ